MNSLLGADINVKIENSTIIKVVLAVLVMTAGIVLIKKLAVK